MCSVIFCDAVFGFKLFVATRCVSLYAMVVQTVLCLLAAATGAGTKSARTGWVRK